MLKIALICGGPSLERGISLNSARSVMDHLASPEIQIVPLYVDHLKNFYLLAQDQLYSNTPSDFDYKLNLMAQPLSTDELVAFFQEIDVAFPVIHGAFGEDGELQELLEKYQVPYVGSEKNSCQMMFCKHKAAQILKKHGFSTVPSICLKKGQPDRLSEIQQFFERHSLQRAIIKPTKGGSSIGVFSVVNAQEAHERCSYIFDQKIDEQALLEVFCEGQEFTVLVLENEANQPVALLPTEIEMDYSQNQIFDYRRKYLPTNQATYHTPPRFDLATINQIRTQAEALFKLFSMRDFVRLDGWILKDGTICFTDINPLCGLEQNSFLFRQAAVLGMTHRQTLRHLLKRVCKRANLHFPELHAKEDISKLPVYVLFGNHNAERQVSLMTGTNIWLKLLQSDRFKPIPCLFDSNSDVWQLPYSHALNHTVEEVYHNCLVPEKTVLAMAPTIQFICEALHLDLPIFTTPSQFKLEQFFSKVKNEKAFLFIAMHGADGENGTLQRLLEMHQIPFNGSDSKTSALCMDKYDTGLMINQLNDPDISALPKTRIDFTHAPFTESITYKRLWSEFCQYLGSSQLIIKPRSDGCSAGIVVLRNAEELMLYAKYVQAENTYIPAHTFQNQAGTIEMPLAFKGEHLLEPYLEMDSIFIQEKTLLHTPKQGWVEITVGVFEDNGEYWSLNPSIAIAEGAILSLEEKFQGGTGVNLTPPPEQIISVRATQKIKELVAKTAKVLGIQNYARLDFFFNRETEKMLLIEANTLPGLTPSTVFYHQALAEDPPLTPKAFIERIIDCKYIHNSSKTS